MNWVTYVSCTSSKVRKTCAHECSMTFCSLAKCNENPPPIRLYTNPWLFLTNSSFYWHVKGFNRAFATDAVCWQGTLTPLNTWSNPIWDLNMFYLLRPIFSPNLSLFFRTRLFEHPSILSRVCFENVCLTERGFNARENASATSVHIAPFKRIPVEHECPVTHWLSRGVIYKQIWCTFLRCKLRDKMNL